MRKKILILVPSLTRGGGAEKVASALSLNLSKKYDISIVTFFHPLEIYPFKGKYYSIQEKHYLRSIFLRYFKIHKIIRSISPDIIITCMNKASFWIIPIKIFSKINTPLIILMCTNPNYHYRKKFYFKYIIKFLYPSKKVDLIVPVSKELKNILVYKYKLNEKKIKPIYTGTDIHEIQLLSKEKIEDYKDVFENSDIIKFITIGRLSYEKGHKYLINAYSKVIKEIPASRLFIIGDGPIRTELQELIEEKQLQDNVKLLGFKKNAFKYISKADILVLSSLHEGLPFVLIEALACNLPIISTNCETGPKEILENGRYGILTNVADSNDLAKKMIYLAKNKEARVEFSRKSIEKIKVFEIQEFVNNWFKLIDSYFRDN
jgi:glycosyltransferase involved in cell wall biosynthesis